MLCNFQFALCLGVVISVPNWPKQHKGTYEVLAGMLEWNVIFNQIPAKALKAFTQVSGKEPNI